MRYLHRYHNEGELKKNYTEALEIVTAFTFSGDGKEGRAVYFGKGDCRPRVPIFTNGTKELMFDAPNLEELEVGSSLFDPDPNGDGWFGPGTTPDTIDWEIYEITALEGDTSVPESLVLTCSLGDFTFLEFRPVVYPVVSGLQDEFYYYLSDDGKYLMTFFVTPCLEVFETIGDVPAMVLDTEEEFFVEVAEPETGYAGADYVEPWTSATNVKKIKAPLPNGNTAWAEYVGEVDVYEAPIM